MRVRVKQSDIDKGKECSVSACPVALALARAMPRGAGKCSVGNWIFQVTAYNHLLAYPLPRSVVLWVGVFDNGGVADLKPLEFDVPEVRNWFAIVPSTKHKRAFDYLSASGKRIRLDWSKDNAVHWVSEDGVVIGDDTIREIAQEAVWQAAWEE